ncbi:unnamed protein product [Cuscuta epithymum]|uniref:Uncharacterized protein n=1 Tax=Cuscuta epithymum TaxID=186058 RepID=A0AAV0GL19_9ASTE|nr:unnamed protein product [Cuscuta epithymum]
MEEGRKAESPPFHPTSSISNVPLQPHNLKFTEIALQRMSRFDNAIRLKLYLPSEKHVSPNLDGPTPNLLCGGLFLDLAVPAPPSILKSLSVKCRRRTGFRRGTGNGESFLSVSLSAGDRKRDVVDGSPGECLRPNGDKVGSAVETGSGAALDQKRMMESRRLGAVNTTKHLWAGAVAAMISRFGLNWWHQTVKQWEV